ncbi:MAG: hypothetical protein JJE46_11295 [Acidimicrobiia bacterium]|nr:hypothetical protein [Acidimicrobiia bacterium]
MTQHFRYELDMKLVPFWGPFGVRPRHDGVTLDEQGLRATFGFVTLETTLDNLSAAHITTDYRWWTAAGARLSFADDGLTLGTTAAGGVCIHFVEPVPSLLRRKGHSALTVTVADRDGLADAIERAVAQRE